MELGIALVMLAALGGLIITGLNSTNLGLTGSVATAANTIVPLAFLGLAITFMIVGGRKAVGL